MKKFTKIVAISSLLLTASACVYGDQKINLAFDSSSNKISEIGQHRKISVEVVDKRQNKEILGQKTYGQDQVVDVIAANDLEAFLKNKISHNLISRGFQFGNDRKIEIRVEKLSYNVKRGFISPADIEANFRVIVKNYVGREIFDKNYSMEQTDKYLVMPLKSMVEKNINNFVKDMINEIVEDQKFINVLVD